MKQLTSSRPISPSDQAAGVRSLSRALDLLEVFPEHGPEIGLSQVANLAKMNKATAFRLLATLEERGYVVRSPEGKKYRLGMKLFELGSYYQGQLELRRLALPHLKAMVKQTNEAAFLCIREEDEALCVERVEAEYGINIFTLRVGGRQPLHLGAAPRTLLAGLDDTQIEAYARRTVLQPVTPYTMTRVEDLIRDAHLTRQQGYAVSLDDAHLGIAAVGAPVYDYTGCMAASISLSGLSRNYTQEYIAGLLPVLMDAAQQISAQLGFCQRD